MSHSTAFSPAQSVKTLSGTAYSYHSLPATADALGIKLELLPYSLRPILEGIARSDHCSTLEQNPTERIALVAPPCSDCDQDLT